MRFLLWLSLALNLLLLTSIVAARVDPSRERVMVPHSSGTTFRIDSPETGALAVGEIDELLRFVDSSAFSTQGIKALAMAWLVAKYRDAYEASWAEFWQADYRPGAATLRMELAIERQVREALIEYFGAGAVDDPAFDSVFRPLGPEYAFLSSDSQLRIRESRLAAVESAEAEPTMQAGRLARCAALSGATARRPWPDPSLELSPAAEREYLLRFSPLSEELRQTQAASGEAEFRSLFAGLLELQQDPTPGGQARLRDALRSTMGNAAFDRFWSGRDPFYSHVEDYLLSQGHSEHLVQQAYAVVNRSQQRLLAAMAMNTNAQATLQEASRIRQDELSELSRVLGDETALGLANALREAAVSVARGPTTDC